MKRKIALILAMIMCQSVISAHAQMDKPIYDIFTNEIKITGKTSSQKEGRPISVKILNPDNTLQYANTGFSGKNGVYEFNLKLHMDDVDDYGEYKVLVSGYDYSNPDEKTIYLAAPDTEITDIINKINTKSETELSTNILDYAEKLHLNFDLFTQIDTAELVRIIKQEVNQKQFSADDMSDVHKRLKKSAIITAYNKGNTDLVTDGTAILYDDILELENLDKNGVTLYSIYKTRLSDEGKRNLNSAMLNKGFNKIADWEKEFLTQIVLKTINYPSVGGVAYVSEVITEQNASEVDLTAAGYLALSDKSSVNSSVARKKYNSITALKAALTPKKDSNNGSSNSGNSGNSSGGSGIRGGNVPVILGTNNENTPTLEMKIFADIPTDYWLFDALYDLKELEIVSGDAEGNFRPDNYVRREEFLKMLCEALEIPKTKSDKEFSDIENNSWYKTYVDTAYENKIVNGIEENIFGVGRYITRQDLCAMVYRALNVCDEDTEKPVFGFNDNEAIADYAHDAIDYMYMNKIVNGFEDNTFRPNENCTRAHAAKIIYYVMQNLKNKATE